MDLEVPLEAGGGGEALRRPAPRSRPGGPSRPRSRRARPRGSRRPAAVLGAGADVRGEDRVSRAGAGGRAPRRGRRSGCRAVPRPGRPPARELQVGQGAVMVLRRASVRSADARGRARPSGDACGGRAWSPRVRSATVSTTRSMSAAVTPYWVTARMEPFGVRDHQDAAVSREARKASRSRSTRNRTKLVTRPIRIEQVALGLGDAAGGADTIKRGEAFGEAPGVGVILGQAVDHAVRASSSATRPAAASTPTWRMPPPRVCGRAGRGR